MMRPSVNARELVSVTITSVPSAFAGNEVGNTSSPEVAVKVMSSVRFAAFTVKVPVSPVPLITMVYCGAWLVNNGKSMPNVTAEPFA